MTLLEQYIDCMKKGNNVALSELFEEKGVLHDSSVNKVGQDTIHLEGKMAVDMMFHHRFGFNGGPFQILDVQYQEPNTVSYIIMYQQKFIPLPPLSLLWRKRKNQKNEYFPTLIICIIYCFPKNKKSIHFAVKIVSAFPISSEDDTKS
ncbi:MAG: hypothetical protein ACLRX7_07730 [Acutalibacteraceae bacterium]